MNTVSKVLTESVLRRLTSDAITTFLGEAAFYETAARPGLQLALSNEPVADLNMLIVGAPADYDHFRAMVQSCLERQLPFLVTIFPEAAKAIIDISADLGLVYAADFPFMVLQDQVVLAPSGKPEIEVVCRSCAEDADASADVLVSAYGIPKDSVVRALPPSLFKSTATDLYLARANDESVGSVVLTYHGDTCGIWAMGTKASHQHCGIGRRLLSEAMVQARRSGIQRFFLGATPAGYRLYERLGFKTVCTAGVWVSGETHQS